MRRFLAATVVAMICLGAPASANDTAQPGPGDANLVGVNAAPLSARLQAAQPVSRIVTIQVAVPSALNQLRMTVRSQGPIPLGSYNGVGGLVDTSGPYYGVGSGPVPFRRY